MHRHTNFGAWVERVGVTWIVDRLRAMGQETAITPPAVYSWWRREHQPRMAKIRALVQISDGAITVQDVFDHFDVQQVEAAPNVTV